jgi:hypothetical protein
MKKKVHFLPILLCAVFLNVLFNGREISPAYGADNPARPAGPNEAKVIYLDIEAMCGAKALPYRYLVIPEEYVQARPDPRDLKIDLSKMVTEEPADLKTVSGAREKASQGNEHNARSGKKISATWVFDPC